MSENMNTQNLVEVKNLCKYFKVGKKQILKAVDNVSFNIRKGETLGLVGESGCGKTTCGRTIIKLYDATSGEVLFDGQDISKIKHREESLKFKKNAQIIFQDPYASLNPRMSVSEIIAEPMKLHKLYSKDEIFAHTQELMKTVGLAERLTNSYPHELDGGRRQRIGIARALALNPKFIVCDEPVSALDVSIQAQILNLLQELQEKLGLTYIFITHDLSVVHYFSDDIAVMYLGRLIEKAPSVELFANPSHPYTQALLSAIPIPKLGAKKERIVLKGEITSPVNPKPMCRFAPRCIHAKDICFKEEPKMKEIAPGHEVMCHLF